MSRRLATAVLGVVFAALFLVPVAVRRSRRAAAPAAVSARVAIARYGFALRDISTIAGVRVVHEPPLLDPKLAPIMADVAALGASVAVADFDRDGWLDFYVTTSVAGGRNHLFHNNHDGTFTDVAERMGVADLNQDGGVCMGAVWGDYDNDGYDDLLVYKWGRPELFHNDKGKRFTRVTASAGLPSWVNANNAIWFDYDGDGRLDLLISGYYPDSVDLQHLSTTRMMPDSFEYAANGGRKYLLRNLGDGRFKDVTQMAGLTSTRWTLAAVAGDFRGTGLPDVFLANDYGVPQYFANTNGRFHEVGREVGIADKPKSGMNASVGDVFGDGRLGIYESNISEAPEMLQGNNLFIPRSLTRSPHFENLAHDLGVESGGWSFGAQFGDLNNDGNVDLYLTNGFISGDRRASYWYDFTVVAGGNSTIIRDAANWPAIGTRSLAGYQQKCVWLNDGTGRFTDVAQAVGARDRYDGRAIALADLFNDGALDVIEANQRGPLVLYRNQVDPRNHWIEFELRGTRSNRDGIGAIVTLEAGGRRQTRLVTGGEGFAAENMRRVHFGLGRATSADRVTVRWPSGTHQTLVSVPAGHITQVAEPR